ncbi:MAG: glycosyltransferase, partial [Methylophilaceae bacterium]
AVSQSLLNNLKDYGIEHPNSFVIPSGVDAKLFKPAQMKDNKLIIAVGRFVEKKSPATTISAFSVISKMHPNVRLEMVGDGELLEECKILAERLGVRNKILFQ